MEASAPADAAKPAKNFRRFIIVDAIVPDGLLNLFFVVLSSICNSASRAPRQLVLALFSAIYH